MSAYAGVTKKLLKRFGSKRGEITAYKVVAWWKQSGKLRSPVYDEKTWKRGVHTTEVRPGRCVRAEGLPKGGRGVLKGYHVYLRRDRAAEVATMDNATRTLYGHTPVSVVLSVECRREDLVGAGYGIWEREYGTRIARREQAVFSRVIVTREAIKEARLAGKAGA